MWSPTSHENTYDNIEWCNMSCLIIILLEVSRHGSSRRFPSHIYRSADFKFSGGCFGTDIIQKCTKWFQIGVHRLICWPIFTKFTFAFFLMRTNMEKRQYGRKKNTCSVSWKNRLQATRLIPKLEKNMFSDISYLNSISSIIYDEFNLKYVKHQICLRRFD